MKNKPKSYSLINKGFRLKSQIELITGIPQAIIATNTLMSLKISSHASLRLLDNIMSLYYCSYHIKFRISNNVKLFQYTTNT